MAGKYVIYQTEIGFKFDLKASNGETILSSQEYASLATCRRGVESIRKNAQRAALIDLTDVAAVATKNPKFEVFADAGKTFRFCLRAMNGQIVGTSEAYKAKKSCLNGIESVRKNALDATVLEEL